MPSNQPTYFYDVEQTISDVSKFVEFSNCSLSYFSGVWIDEGHMLDYLDWDNFQYNLYLRLKDYSTAKISWLRKGADCTRCVHVNSFESLYTCNESIIASRIMFSLAYNITDVFSCGKHTWKVANCGQRMGLCVDCNSPCQCDNNAVLPLNSDCMASNGGEFTGLCLDLFSQREPPSYSSITVAKSDNDASIDILVKNVEAPSFLICAAFEHADDIIVDEIIRNGEELYITSYGDYVIEISDLVIGLQYFIACATKSVYSPNFGQIASTLEEVLQKVVVYKIQSTRQILLNVDYSQLPVGTSYSITFTVNGIPTENLFIVPKLYYTSTDDCETGFDSKVNIDNLFPSMFFLGQNSIPLKDYTVYFDLLNDGCYYFTLLTSLGQSLNYDNDSSNSLLSFPFNSSSLGLDDFILGITAPRVLKRNVILFVYGALTAPAAPSLYTATFSAWGESILIAFDAATDRAASVLNIGDSIFACSLLFNFKGVERYICAFLSDFVVEARFIPSTTGSNLVVNDYIDLIGNMVKPKCSSDWNCTNYPFAEGSYISLRLPAITAPVNVVLFSNKLVNDCNDVLLDFEQSTGHGGRSWISIQWQVFEDENTLNTTLTQYLNFESVDCYSNDYHCKIMPSNLLSAGKSYSYVLALKNYLGRTGVGSTTMLKLETSSLSTVILDKQNYQQLHNIHNIKVNARVQSGCANLTRLDYYWNIYVNGYQTRLISSKGPFKNIFVADRNDLKPNNYYSFEVIVYDPVLNSRDYGAIDIYIPKGSIKVILTGGTFRSISVHSKVLLDASSSFIDDNSFFNNDLDYSWTCFESFPSIKECDLPQVLLNMSILEVPSGLLTLSHIYTFVVKVSLEGYESVYANTTLNVVSPNEPEVFNIMLSENDKISYDNILNVDTEIALHSEFSLNRTMNVSWAIDEHGSLKDKLFPSSVAQYFPYRLTPNFLNYFRGYTFRLVTTGVSCDGCQNSIGEVKVAINRPPLIGDFKVFPQKGISGIGGTLFALTTINVVDSDLPLDFSYYYQKFDNKRVTISLSAAFSFIESYLPCGNQSLGYLLTVGTKVIDSLGGVSYANSNVTVNQEIIFNDNIFFQEVNDTLYRPLLLNVQDMNIFYFGLATSVVSNYLFGNNIVLDEALKFSILHLRNNLPLFPDTDLLQSLLSLGYVVEKEIPWSSAERKLEFLEILNTKYFEFSSDIMLFGKDIIDLTDSVITQLSLFNADDSNMQSAQELLDLTVSLINQQLLLGDTVTFSGASVDLTTSMIWPHEFGDGTIASLSAPHYNDSRYDYADFSNITQLVDPLSLFGMRVQRTWRFKFNDPTCFQNGNNTICKLVSSSKVSEYSITLLTTASIDFPTTMKMESYLVNIYDYQPNITTFTDRDSQISSKSCDVGSTEQYTLQCSYLDTHGPPYVESRNCPGYLFSATLFCPVYNKEPICGNSYGMEIPDCIATYVNSTYTRCTCPISSSGGLVNNTFTRRRLIDQFYDYTFSIGVVTLFATVESVHPLIETLNNSFPPTNIPTSLPTIPAAAKSAQSNIFSDERFSISFSFGVLLFILFTLYCIYLYRRRRRDAMTEKYLVASKGEDVETKNKKLVTDFFAFLKAARVLKDDRQYGQSEDMYLKAIEIYEDSDDDLIDSIDAAAAYYELADVMSTLNKHLEALPYYQRAHKLFKKRKITKEEAEYLIPVSLGVLYQGLLDDSNSSGSGSSSSYSDSTGSDNDSKTIESKESDPLRINSMNELSKPISSRNIHLNFSKQRAQEKDVSDSSDATKSAESVPDLPPPDHELIPSDSSDESIQNRFAAAGDSTGEDSDFEDNLLKIGPLEVEWNQRKRNYNFSKYEGGHEDDATKSFSSLL